MFIRHFLPIFAIELYEPTSLLLFSLVLFLFRLTKWPQRNLLSNVRKVMCKSTRYCCYLLFSVLFLFCFVLLFTIYCNNLWKSLFYLMTKLFFLPTLINKPISMQICFLRRQENQTKAKSVERKKEPTSGEGVKRPKSSTLLKR